MLAFGVWRLVVRSAGDSAYYFWVKELRKTEEDFEKIRLGLEESRSKLDQSSNDLPKGELLAEQMNVKNLEQLHRDLGSIKAALTDRAASMELRLGTYAVVLGVGLLGIAIFQIRKSRGGPSA